MAILPLKVVTIYNLYNLSIEVFLSYLNCLVSSSTLVTGFKAGKSVEGKDIMALKISTGGSKPAIFIGKSVKNSFFNFQLFIPDGGIHAREWISPATVTGIIQSMVQNTNRLFCNIV